MFAVVNQLWKNQCKSGNVTYCITLNWFSDKGTSLFYEFIVTKEQIENHLIVVWTKSEEIKMQKVLNM